MIHQVTFGFLISMMSSCLLPDINTNSKGTTDHMQVVHTEELLQSEGVERASVRVSAGSRVAEIFGVALGVSSPVAGQETAVVSGGEDRERDTSGRPIGKDNGSGYCWGCRNI